MSLVRDTFSMTTPSRFHPGAEESEDGDTDSSSPGNNTSDGSPGLRQALSGEDAVESPPLRMRSQHPFNSSGRSIKQISSPSDLEDDQDSSSNSSPTSSSDKPSQSYIALISMAILQHPEKKMLLGDIYQFIMDKFPHYRNATDKAWRNSIRHNLSINECFIKVGRADNGKGNFWAIHPACEEDFGKGDFRRRQARRRARRSQQMNISKMPLTYRYSLGYVPMKSTPAAGEADSGASTNTYGATSSTRSHPYAGRPGAQYRYPQQPAYNHHLQHSGMPPFLNYQNSYLPPVTTGSSPPGSASSYQSAMLGHFGGYGSHPTSVNTFTSTPSSLGVSPFLQVSRPSQMNMEGLDGVYQSMHASSVNASNFHSSRGYGISAQTTQVSPSLHESLTSCVYDSTGSPPFGSSHLGVTSSPPPGSEINVAQSGSPTFSSVSPQSGGIGVALPQTSDSSPPGGFTLYNGSPLTNYSQLSYCDMPALRDAINGLTSLNS